jgi:exopolysaccharide biosynthesis protein
MILHLTYVKHVCAKSPDARTPVLRQYVKQRLNVKWQLHLKKKRVNKKTKHNLRMNQFFIQSDNKYLLTPNKFQVHFISPSETSNKTFRYNKKQIYWLSANENKSCQKCNFSSYINILLPRLIPLIDLL